MAATIKNLIKKYSKSKTIAEIESTLIKNHKIPKQKVKEALKKFTSIEHLVRDNITSVHKAEVTNLVVISDTHCGCKLAIMPKEGIRLDEGGTYKPSDLQLGLIDRWNLFWNEFVPEVTKGEKYSVLHNGDAIDGVHHNSVTQISHNLLDQTRIAQKLLEPIVDKCEGRYYHIRGTEAHVGKSAQQEEELAEKLGAIPNEQGMYARYDLRYSLAGHIIHALHHIGSTGSQAYEATAVHKEMTECYLEAARWGNVPPDIIVRSHRHRNIEIAMPIAKKIKNGVAHTARAVVTPCWQGKTPFAWKIPGARLSTPQFGGVVIRSSGGEVFVKSLVWTVDPSEIATQDND